MSHEPNVSRYAIRRSTEKVLSEHEPAVPERVGSVGDGACQNDQDVPLSSGPPESHSRRPAVLRDNSHLVLRGRETTPPTGLHRLRRPIGQVEPKGLAQQLGAVDAERCDNHGYTRDGAPCPIHLVR